jgi:hypothetical protein
MCQGTLYLTNHDFLLKRVFYNPLLLLIRSSVFPFLLSLALHPLLPYRSPIFQVLILCPVLLFLLQFSYKTLLYRLLLLHWTIHHFLVLLLRSILQFLMLLQHLFLLILWPHIPKQELCGLVHSRITQLFFPPSIPYVLFPVCQFPLNLHAIHKLRSLLNGVLLWVMNLMPYLLIKRGLYVLVLLSITSSGINRFTRSSRNRMVQLIGIRHGWLLRGLIKKVG